MHDMPLNKASSLLSSYFGYEVRIEDATPLVQWANTTAYRLKLQHPRQNGSCPDTAIMKGPYEGYDASYLAMWRPAWRLAQDYVNLRFFHEIGAGQYVPTLCAYDPQAGFILMQDLGEMDLHKFERNRFFGHVVGDLWHQHVILSNQTPALLTSTAADLTLSSWISSDCWKVRLRQ